MQHTYESTNKHKMYNIKFCYLVGATVRKLTKKKCYSERSQKCAIHRKNYSLVIRSPCYV